MPEKWIFLGDDIIFVWGFVVEFVGLGADRYFEDDYVVGEEEVIVFEGEGLGWNYLLELYGAG